MHAAEKDRLRTQLEEREANMKKASAELAEAQRRENELS